MNEQYLEFGIVSGSADGSDFVMVTYHGFTVSAYVPWDTTETPVVSGQAYSLSKIGYTYVLAQKVVVE